MEASEGPSLQAGEQPMFDGQRKAWMEQYDVLRAIELLEKVQKSGEVPAHQLAQLQGVLRSEFLAAVLGVYEHVYDTCDAVSIAGSVETRASATAKATVAAFAAAEGQAHPRLVTLTRAGEGLGFNVAGGQEPAAPVLVSRVVAGGPAARQGGLRRGDQLLAVDGVSVAGESHAHVVQLLQEAGQTVTLLVRHTPALLDSLERRQRRCAGQRPGRGR